MGFIDFFKGIGRLIGKAFSAAKASGLSDELVQMALPFVRAAAAQFTDNAQRREFVVGVLVAKGIPESIARLTVELAVQLIKKETATI